MTDFIPPYPPRFTTKLPVWKRLLLARRSLIGMWEEKDFEYEFASGRLLTRQTFLCNCPDAVRFAFSTHNDSFERKSPQQRHALAPLVGDGTIISDGPTWRFRRRLVAPIIHASRLADFSGVMVQAAVETRDRWLALPPGTEIDVHREMGTLTADIICRTVFGSSLPRADAREVTESFSDYQNLIEQVDLASLIGLPDWFPRPRSRALRDAVARIHAVLDRLIADHRDGDETSVLGRLLHARDADTGEPLGAEALRNEIAVVFLAGLESSANGMTWTWYLVSQVPEVEARLHAEIDEVLAGRLPAFEDAPKLVYTRAVIDETLRLYPPLPFLSREAVREETFRDRTIPKGSLIFVVPWLLHRQPKFWDRPDHFVPDRFMPGSPPPSKFAYIPFSIGPRICSGMAFGTIEAILCIATIAQKIRLTLRPGYEVRPVARLTLRPDGGIPMTVHPRP
ncbi:MAG: cytochrome P450 [Pseudorhodoplanes sp.]|uniref:cytochrome P450 n=1 Tax=Pseudorhodoplanes sp. TaxID=1934341 RepID=UPI003D0AA9B1